jgi:hypothetical protein
MAGLLHSLHSTEIGLKFTEKLYPAYTNDPSFRLTVHLGMMRYKSSQNKKSNAQINREIRLCKSYWKCYPYQYFIQDLYLASRQLTDEELTGYIPDFFWYRLFLPHHNSQRYSLIGENKIVMNHFFRSLAIPCPETLGYILNGSLYSPDMELIDAYEISKRSKGIEKIFVKPVDGCGGKGIYVFHKNNHGVYTTSSGIFFHDHIRELLKNSGDAIIQGGISQDPDLSALYSGSVNTFRIVTENIGGKARVVSVMMRMGRGNNEVDNVSSGGISTYVNPTTGKINDFAISSDRKKYFEHPDTHFSFHNHFIRRWDEIKNFSIKCAELMPFLTYLGWDIALTPEGPVVIEINRMPAIYNMEMTHKGLRDAFGIDNPDFYWKNSHKKQVSRG